MHRVSIAIEFTCGEVGVHMDLPTLEESLEEVVATAGGMEIQVEVTDVEAV